MPLKIVSDKHPWGPSEFATSIPMRTIVKMVQNFIDRTFKGPRKITHDMDSHAVYYTKREIDDLFAANGYDPNHPDASKYGLRIYLAVHANSELERASMPNRPVSYLDQHTVILVTTKDKTDLLNEGNYISSFIQDSGQGLEEGQLCPPPRCGSIDDLLKP